MMYLSWNQIDPSMSKQGRIKREDAWSRLSQQQYTAYSTSLLPDVWSAYPQALKPCLILLRLTWSPHFTYWNPTTKGRTEQFAIKILNINGKLNTLAKPIPKRAMLAIMSFLAWRTGNATANVHQPGDMHAIPYLRSATSRCLNVIINKKW